LKNILGGKEKWRQFFSHSRKDKELSNRIYKACSRVHIKLNIAEFEELEAGRLTAEKIIFIRRTR